MRTKIGALLAIVFVLALGVLPASALAAQEPTGTLAAGKLGAIPLTGQSEGIVDQGTFGTCNWEVYEHSDGDWVLYIEPSNGEYGYLESTYYDQSTDGSTAPWYEYSEYLDAIDVSGYILAGDSCNCLFCDCPNVKWISITGLDTSETTTMNDMFYGNTSLETIFVSNLWSIENVEYSDDMFYNCNSLEGGNGTPFYSDCTDCLYANVDYPNNPGYFTSLYMGDADINLSAWSYVFDGSAKMPHVTATIGNETLTNGENFTVSYSGNVNAGTATVKVVGTGIYEGEQSVTFSIAPAPLSFVALNGSSFKYTGKAQKPSVNLVKAGNLKLSPSNYRVSYSNNSSKKAGTYKITVTGVGNFTGTQTFNYKITQASNKATAKKTSVKKTLKADDLMKKAATVTLPKVTTKFGTAKWTVSSKDAKKVLSLKNGKVKVKKNAKKGTYTIKLKAKVAKTANYKAASTKVVTVKVKVN